MTRGFDQTAEGWDAAAVEYDRLFAPYTRLFAADVVAAAPPSANDEVLEVAAGSGALTRQLAERARRVTATDLSPAMIASLCDNVGRANVVTAVMDAEALSFADSVFDGVYSMFGMLFLVDVGQGVEEMVRVTKPGGRCVIATWRGPEKSRLLAPIAAAVTAMMPDSPVARKLHEPPPLSDPSELRERMKQAGLGDITIREVSHPLKMTKDAYLREFPQANPAGLEMQRRMPEQAFTQLGVAIRNQLDAEFPSNEISLLGVAHIAAGFKSLGAIR